MNPGSTQKENSRQRTRKRIRKTSGRGEKGQKARSGASIKPWFEGGQTPLYKRLPRRGFNNKMFTTRYSVVNVSDLNRFEDNTTVTPEMLKEAGLVKKN